MTLRASFRRIALPAWLHAVVDCNREAEPDIPTFNKGFQMWTAASDEALLAREARALMTLFEGALSTRDPQGWSTWLQSGIQRFLPHDALLCAWGDLRGDAPACDVVTASPTLPAGAPDAHLGAPMMVHLFANWLAAGRQPLAIEGDALRTAFAPLATLAPCALVHGIEDLRGRYECVYVFVGPAELASHASRQLCRVLTPLIDAVLRQLPAAGGTSERGGALSAREREVMDWVCLGKTNSEIASILSLSTFTVKNHMRRIYRKLDVLNRAQAVGSLARMPGARSYASH
jgi:transcriptional regulator EpsA